jgi:hypothetical protein
MLENQDEFSGYSAIPTAISDDEATAFLPPCQAAHQTYHAARNNGYSPADALKETLMLWRELHQDARPVLPLRRPS